MMPPDSVKIVVHALCHLNDDERPLKGCDQAPLDRSLSSEIMGETVPNVPQCLLAQHGGLQGLFRLDGADLAPRNWYFSLRPARRDPGPSISGAQPGRYCGQHRILFVPTITSFRRSW
jgi:hypothetical protein